jgi:hypothetical protein
VLNDIIIATLLVRTVEIWDIAPQRIRLSRSVDIWEIASQRIRLNRTVQIVEMAHGR